MPLDEVGWNIDCGSDWNEVLAQLILAQRFTGQHPTSWIQAHSFVDDLTHVEKMGKITESGAVRQSVEFTPKASLDLRVLGDQIPSPIQSTRRGLVPCNNQR